MNKVLLLGVNGFLARHFQDYVLNKSISDKYNFIGVDLFKRDDCKIDFEICDLTDYQQFDNVIKSHNPDYIINFAGIFNNEKTDKIIEINAGISKHICDIIIKNNLKIKKLILIGSAAEYGVNNKLPLDESAPLKPINHYGLSKAIQTSYANYYATNYNIPINVARIFNVIGRNISEKLSIGAFIKQIENANNGDIIYTGNLDTKRDFLAVEDAISAIIIMMEKGKSGEIYNICSGKPLEMKTVIETMIKASGKKLSIKIDSAKIRTADIPISYGTSEKFSIRTGWKPNEDIIKYLEKLF